MIQQQGSIPQLIRIFESIHDSNPFAMYRGETQPCANQGANLGEVICVNHHSMAVIKVVVR
jgi:hypothetical protein